MSIENIHLLEKEIHQTFNWDNDIINSLTSRIGSLLVSYPISESQNFHMFTHLLQELNRKLDKFGFSENISRPVDAGFRPLNIEDFFGNSPTPGANDYLKLEDSSYLFQENAFKLILEQDI